MATHSNGNGKHGGLQEYKDSWKEGRRVNATMEHDVYAAAVALSDKTRKDDGLLDYEQIKNPEFRKGLEKEFYDTLIKNAAGYLKAEDPGTDEHRRSALLIGTYGVSLDQVGNYLDSTGEKFQMTGLFTNLIRDNQVYRFVQGQHLTAVPQRHLSVEQKEEVLKETGVKDRVKVDEITSKADLAGLLNEWMDEGVVTDSFLREHRWLKEAHSEQDHKRA